MYLLSPTGTRIIGTLERLSGRAEAEQYEADGTPIYDGGTEIFYDDQETVTRDNSLVYLDEEGTEWLFGQLSPDRDGHDLHHDIQGWYIVSPDEERDEQGFGPDGVSLGFDGRDHYVTEAEAWAAFEAGDAP